MRGNEHVILDHAMMPDVIAAPHRASFPIMMNGWIVLSSKIKQLWPQVNPGQVVAFDLS
jgi:hypothetical protein